MLNLITNIQEKPKCALDVEITKQLMPISFLVIDNLFTIAECDKMAEYIKNHCQLDKGKNREGEETKYRNSDVSFIELTKDIEWFYSKIVDRIIPINEKYQKFDLTHLDRLQYAQYGVEQYLDLHADDFFDFISKDPSLNNLLLRKLSVSVGLNDDYEGGDFEMQVPKGLGEDAPYDIRRFRLQKGSAIVFPSFQLHKIYPVTKGTRKAIVAWFFGPKWR